MEYAVKSLVGVVRREKHRLDSLERRLRNSPAIMQADLIRETAESADALSAALTRLASYVREMPGENGKAQRPPKPTPDQDMLEGAMRAFAAIRFGLTKNGCLRRSDYERYLDIVHRPEYGTEVY